MLYLRPCYNENMSVIPSNDLAHSITPETSSLPSTTPGNMSREDSFDDKVRTTGLADPKIAPKTPENIREEARQLMGGWIHPSETNLPESTEAIMRIINQLPPGELNTTDHQEDLTFAPLLHIAISEGFSEVAKNIIPKINVKQLHSKDEKGRTVINIIAQSKLSEEDKKALLEIIPSMPEPEGKMPDKVQKKNS